ncbi:non-ribosomal peptide synthetase, partial [Pseudomonas syringae group genomosp. 3]
NLAHALHLYGELDVQSLHLALIDLVQRHESLRTRFASQDGVPSQLILERQQVELDLPVQDVTLLQLPTVMALATNGTFDLAQQLPIRCILYRINPHQHTLLLLVHHIACDGWSMAPLLHDLSHAYGARRQGQEPNRPALAVQYADYALWQQKLLGDENDPNSLIARQINYWRTTLADLPEQLDLPLDHPRPSVASHRGGVVELRIEAALHIKLLTLARTAHCSLYMVLQAALATLLSRLGAGHDIPLGAAVAGRTDDALDELIGFFVNTLVVRIDTSADPSFSTLLQRVRRQALGAYAHQDLPFERLVEVLNPTRSSARHPLFQILLVLHNMDQANSSFDGLQSRFEALNNQQAKFDIATFLTEDHDSIGNPAGLNGRIEYASELFEARTIERFTEQYLRVLTAVADNDQLAIGAIDLLSELDRQQILVEWNATEHPVPATSLPALFEEQVGRRPHAEALIHAGQRISYQELNRRANQLAHHLIGLGIGPEDIVGLCLPRSPNMIVALLAVLKAGAAYLPLDPDYPAARLAMMLEDAKPIVVLGTRTRPLSGTTRLIALDEQNVIEQLALHPDENPDDQHRVRALRPEHPAYVIYTSGSTGKPKGVIIESRNLSNFLSTLDTRIRFDDTRTLLSITTLNFDISALEIFMPLTCGARLVLACDESSKNPEKLARLIRSEHVDVMQATPTFWQLFIDADVGPFPALDIIVGGEALSRILASNLLSLTHAHVANLYGPTEATIWSSHIQWQQRVPQAITLGRPLANYSIYVLDRQLNATPIGVAGEVFIAGAGLARGYLGRPGLTAERFVANPHGLAGSRMYRTGDLGRWRSNGELEFIARADDQIKLRGFRIEPGEIEAVIAGHPDVSQVAVVAHEDDAAEMRLVAYVVSKHHQVLDAQALRQYTAKALPHYMVPAAIMPLAHLPLTPNGKLDRRALPAPQFVSHSVREPSTPEEQMIAALFCELLKLQHVGLDDNFFALGGHSLLATRLVSRLHSTHAIEVSIRDIFDTPTVGELVELLSSSQRDSIRPALVCVERPSVLPLSFAQRRLWFLDQLDGPSPTYNLAHALH